jgi:hypothetical protein
MGADGGGAGLGAVTGAAELTTGTAGAGITTGTAGGELTTGTAGGELTMGIAGAELTMGTGGAEFTAATADDGVVAATAGGGRRGSSRRATAVRAGGVGRDTAALLRADDVDGCCTFTGFFAAAEGFAGGTVAGRLSVIPVVDSVVATLRTTSAGGST